VILIEKIAVSGYHKRGKKERKARRWLKKPGDKDDQIDLDGQSRKGFEGKGGSFGEHWGENTGGITFEQQGGGYRPSTGWSDA